MLHGLDTGVEREGREALHEGGEAGEVRRVLIAASRCASAGRWGGRRRGGVRRVAGAGAGAAGAAAGAGNGALGLGW